MTTASFEFKMTPDGRFTDVKEVRMTKLEQVARAISDRLLARHVVMLDDQALDAARAAVKEMREPTILCITADKDGHYSAAEGKAFWQATIDAILNEKPE